MSYLIDNVPEAELIAQQRHFGNVLVLRAQPVVADIHRGVCEQIAAQWAVSLAHNVCVWLTDIGFDPHRAIQSRSGATLLLAVVGDHMVERNPMLKNTNATADALEANLWRASWQPCIELYCNLYSRRVTPEETKSESEGTIELLREIAELMIRLIGRAATQLDEFVGTHIYNEYVARIAGPVMNITQGIDVRALAWIDQKLQELSKDE